MKNTIRTFGSLLLAISTSFAMAHHSAIQFDFATQKSYTGVVKEFAAKNPHMILKLEVTDDKGKHEVEFEGHSTNNMYRNGYRKGMVQVGDTLTVNVAPLKDGKEGGYVVSAKTASGEMFGMQSRQQGDADKLKAAAEGK
jgi:hypothetical protein